MGDYGMQPMGTNFLNRHLRDVRTGYFKHMWYALKLSTHALLIPITGYIHAFFPFLFPALPHKLSIRQVEMGEELFEELQKVLEKEKLEKESKQ
jgi:hypothetical protein